MNQAPTYDRQFFVGRADRVQSSAEVMVGLMKELFQPTSVVDVGCGDGAWLAEWLKLGVTQVKGIDGRWVDQAILKIPISNFSPQDLNQPFTLSTRYSLCTSFEVAEHLTPESASAFVRSLTQLSDLIVFSAAIPGQGGTGHLNEQWQEYWIDQFAAFDFLALDAIAPCVWTSDDVQPCYLQNTLVYVNSKVRDRYPALVQLPPIDRLTCGRRIHPRMWSEKVIEGEDLTRFGLSALLKSIPTAIKSSLANRLSK